MTNICKRTFLGTLLLAFISFTATLQAAPKSEDALVADLSSPKESAVTSALARLEKEYPNSTKALPVMKGLLSDSRLPVKRKAARVLGVWNADLGAADIQKIAELLDSSDRAIIIDGLKSLRGLKAESTIPKIVPLLKHTDKNVIRDACRTLAVLGKKDLIPAIKPLMDYPDVAVQKDAADAISILREK